MPSAKEKIMSKTRIPQKSKPYHHRNLRDITKRYGSGRSEKRKRKEEWKRNRKEWGTLKQQILRGGITDERVYYEGDTTQGN